MAINKEIENEFGVDFTYHKLRSVRVICATEKNPAQIEMIVDSYASKEARIAGKKPVTTKNVILGTDFALDPFYVFLKQKFPCFADGIDDYDNSFKTEPEWAKNIRYIQQGQNGKLINAWSETDEANKSADEQNTVEGE